MPSEYLNIISVNLWQVLISLCNLLILFLAIKKLLYAPVLKIFDARKAKIDEDYRVAAEAAAAAEADRAAWTEQMQSARAEADKILQTATENADRRGEKIVADAREKADGIVRRAEEEAELQKKKAEDGIRREIVDVSALLTEKMLRREIKTEDHRDLIDSFIRDMGDDHDGNE